MAFLQKRQHDISHICVPFLQCKPGVVFSSSYLPSWFLCKIINWNSESFKQQNLVSKIFWMQGLQVTRLSSLGTFLFISRCSLGYQGSLWTYLQVVACFQTQGEHWRAKNQNFTHQAPFLVSINKWAQLLDSNQVPIWCGHKQLGHPRWRLCQ